MNAEKLWEEYQHYTRDITEHGRKLGFAGVAICWIFKLSDFTYPGPVLNAMALFVLYFIADLFQSFSGALTVRFFTEHKEAKMSKETEKLEGDIDKPRWVDYPAFFFFVLKVLLLLAAFAFLVVFLWKKALLQ